MPSDGGLAGALLLSAQLSTDRFLDRLERNRAQAELAADNALLQRESAEIVTRYNQLVADFNDLRRHAIEAAQEADRRGAAITDLQHQVEALVREKYSLEAECERLRQDSKEKGIEITFLRETLRDQHPDRYPLD